MKRVISIYDIAEMVGVSPATVSNVINGNYHKVSLKTRNKILLCLEENGYQPNLTARGLTTGKSFLIGVCLPILDERATQSNLLENNPFFHEFIDGAERVSLKNGYDIIVRGLYRDTDYLEWIKRRRLDGLILLGRFPDDTYKEIIKLNIPVVLTDMYDESSKQFHNVVSNDENGTYLATVHLIKQGHKKICFVASSIEPAGVELERYFGYHRAMVEYNLSEIKHTMVMDYEDGSKFGHQIAVERLDFTGIICTADIAAVGIIRGLQEAGFEVPRDYSIVGFDDIKMLKYIRPSLTTVKQNISLKGETCANILLSDMQKGISEAKTVCIDTELVIRDSTRELK